jgi:hypothetical protein
MGLIGLRASSFIFWASNLMSMDVVYFRFNRMTAELGLLDASVALW